jgi:signal transduction histidine kinase/ActR/RegA family two-component response regulator
MTNRPLRLKSLRLKINAAILVTCATIAIIFTSIYYPYEIKRRQSQLESIHVLLDAVFLQKREELANELFANQKEAMKLSLREMSKVEGIAGISVYGLDTTLFGLHGNVPEELQIIVTEEILSMQPIFRRVSNQGHPYAQYFSTVQVVGERVGYLKMLYDLGELEAEERTGILLVISFFLSIMGISALLLNIMLSRSVIRPASRLRDAIAKVRAGQLGETADVSGADEISQIASDFNEMSTQLLEQHRALSQAIQVKESYASQLEQANRVLEELNTRLEDIVLERTTALRQINEELQKEIEERKFAAIEKRELQEKLARSQKMEAVGLLAGGVAHDLNNVLSGLVSYPDFLLLKLPPESPLRSAISTIRSSGLKAAAIVEDLLALARRGVQHPEVLNLNQDVVQDYLQSPEFDKLKSLHPHLKFVTELAPDLMNIKGSTVHLKKTVMNLIINAAEAQPQEGVVTILTCNEYVDRPVRGYDDVQEGDYVVLSVRDQGDGIAPDDLSRIFEPFYSKKVMGRSGTGLGMAVVWGTIQDHRGYIQIDSEKGQGTVFRLYFPATREHVEEHHDSVPLDLIRGNGEKLLVVDDVQEQREIACVLLSSLGYGVATVSSGEEAVVHIQEHPVDLVVLDMIMDPGMDGLDTYRAILKVAPRQRAIIASGFAESERVREAQRLGAGPYLRKPYTLEALGLTIKRELRRPRREHG